jgi:serine/threonine-protein kinase
VNPELSPEVNAIVLRAMAKSPESRFQTADEFRNALKAVREPQASAAQAPAVGQSVPAPQPQPIAPVMSQPVAPPTAVPAAPADGYTPVNVPLAPPVRKSHRGLWMTLGAVAALLVLAASATVLPRFLATHAGQQAATQIPATTPAGSQTTMAPADTASPAQPTSPLADTTQGSVSSEPAPRADGVDTGQAGRGSAGQTHSGGGSPRPPYTGSKKGGDSDTGDQVAGSGIKNPAPPAPPTGPSAEEIHQAHDRLMNLDARADSARSGVQQIRSQQQAQGLDIRGDLLAAMSRMDRDINAANHALGQNDLKTANEYMERAEGEARTLESFLGR